MSSFRIAVISALVLFFVALSPVAMSDSGGRQSVTVLVASDTSGRNLGTALQYAIAQLFRTVGKFNVQLSSFVLGGFTPEDTRGAHEKLATDILTFGYMEKERISLFLFARDYPGKFIVASQMFRKGAGGELTNAMIEQKLQLAFIAMLQSYESKQFQYLPGAQPETEIAESQNELERSKAIQAGLLFRELAAVQEKPVYMGANIGMARYGTSSAGTSVVNFGGFFGYNFSRRLSLEVNVDLFSYAIAHANFKYRLPLPNKYVYFNVSLGAGKVLSNLTQNRGVESDLRVGETLYGPGFTFEIPMLGAIIRGGVNLFFGSDKVLIGNYGISYSISLGSSDETLVKRKSLIPRIRIGEGGDTLEKPKTSSQSQEKKTNVF